MIGVTVGGYRILEKLGEGGIGEVYRALDIMLDRDVAVKVLHADLAERDEVRERFRQEARTLAFLHHPNIAGIYAFCGQDAVQMMVMELVSGWNLEQHLTRTSLRLQDALDLALQAARGLSYAHGRNIIHRDIKPANLMIDGAGHLKITDFGIARIGGSDRLTRHGAVIGTACYMAPEQIRGEQADARCDIYALGIVLYELLAGRPPFGGDNDYEILRSQVGRRPPPLRLCRPDLPRSVERLLARALQKRPGDRHRSMDEVIAELSAAREDCLEAGIADSIRTAGAARFLKPLVALSVAGALITGGGGFAWINSAPTSPGAAAEIRPELVPRPAASVISSPAPEQAPSVQPAAGLLQAMSREPEPGSSTPVEESHSDEFAQPAELARPEQPLPLLPLTPRVEASAPAAPEPVVQAPPTPTLAAPAEPDPASKPNLSPTDVTKPIAGKPPAGAAFVRKAVQSCSSAWSIKWRAAPAKQCAR